MQAREEHLARAGGAPAGDIRTEREFMDALRVLKARSGLSYRDIAMRMSRVAPRQAMSKSTLAALFAQDTLPRRPGQLTAIVEVLAGELHESADSAARYLAAWTRLMTARPALPGGTADASQRPGQASSPAVPAVPAVPLVPPQARYPGSLYCQPAYRDPCVPAAAHARDESESGQRTGFFAMLVVGTVFSVVTWLPFAGLGFPFWWVWLFCTVPFILLALLTRLSRHSRLSSSDELPAEYVRHEYRRATERLPSWY